MPVTDFSIKDGLNGNRMKGTSMKSSPVGSLRVTTEKWPPERISELWNRKGSPPDSHPYLEKNGIRRPGVPVTVIEGSLAIPMYTIEQGMVNLRFVDGHGHVEYLPGAEVRNTFSTFGGESRLSRGDAIYVCEGWANGWTIHEAAGSLVVVVFDRSALIPVAEGIRRRYPRHRMIVCAINERWTYYRFRSGLRPNPGYRAAARAAERVGGDFVAPDFSSLEGQPVSFNDLRLREGTKAVARSLTAGRSGAAKWQLEGHDVLGVVYYARFPDSDEPSRVGELLYRVATALAESADPRRTEVAEEVRILGAVGIKVVDECVRVSNVGDDWLHERLETRWPHRTWMSLLRELPGARPTTATYFSPVLTSRATAVPLDLLTGFWFLTSLAGSPQGGVKGR